MTKTCDRCRTAYAPGSNRARYCSPECRRAARTEYEERRAAHAFAGARTVPDSIREPGAPTVEDDLRASLTDADGVPAYGAPAEDLPAYLAARRAYLDTLAAVRRRLGMTRTARGWRIPPPKGHPCSGCPLLLLPVRHEVSEEIERHAEAVAVRQAVEESLVSN